MREAIDWPTSRLGDLIVVKYGKALPQAKRRGGSVPVFGSNGVVGAHDEAITSGPTVIIGRKGSSGAVNSCSQACWPIDTTYYIDDPGPFTLPFLELLLGSLGLTELDRSTAIPGLNRDQLYDIEVPVPPVQEQEELVELIGGADRLGASASTHLTASRRAIERFRQALLEAACSGRLTADWREQHPLAAVKPGPPLSLQGARNASGSPNTDALLEIPATWAWWTVESIMERVIDYRGRTPPSAPSGPIPHVRTTQIRNGKIDWATDRFVTQEVYDAYMTRGIPERGDVLFTMEAPMGDVGVVDRDEPFSIAQRILLMRPGEGLDGAFLALALQSHPVRRAIEFRATGSGVLGIAYKRLRSLVVPKPPIGEQQEIVRRVSRLLQVAEITEQRIDLANRRLGRTAPAVLANAFRGDLITDGTRV